VLERVLAGDALLDGPIQARHDAHLHAPLGAFAPAGVLLHQVFDVERLQVTEQHVAVNVDERLQMDAVGLVRLFRSCST